MPARHGLALDRRVGDRECAAGTISVSCQGILNEGSSQHGKASRASTASNCVKAYQLAAGLEPVEAGGAGCRSRCVKSISSSVAAGRERSRRDAVTISRSVPDRRPVGHGRPGRPSVSATTECHLLGVEAEAVARRAGPRAGSVPSPNSPSSTRRDRAGRTPTTAPRHGTTGRPGGQAPPRTA